MIITIDGPVATGKSTVAQKLAEFLGYLYFDTGAMYRAFTLIVLREGVDLNDEKALRDLLNNSALKFDASSTTFLWVKKR